MILRDLYERKGEAVVIYGLILIAIALVFVGINSCARGGFRNQMEGLSGEFISRQRQDELKARRLQENQKRVRPMAGVETAGPSSSPIKSSVSEDTARLIKERSLSTVNPPGENKE